VDIDLDQKFMPTLELLTAENIRAGMPPHEAQRAARIELGGIEQVKEQVREQRLGNWLHSVLSDCRYGLRQLRKSSGATAVDGFYARAGHRRDPPQSSVLYMACCCGRCRTSIRAASWPSSRSTQRVDWSHLADPNFDDFRDQNRSFQTIAKYQNSGDVSVSGASQPTRVAATSVSPDFLKIFGVQPILGRDFRTSDSKKGAALVVLASYGYWRQYLGSSPGPLAVAT